MKQLVIVFLLFVSEVDSKNAFICRRPYFSKLHLGIGNVNQPNAATAAPQSM